MEEVRTSSSPEAGQPNEGLPEPLSIPHEQTPSPNTSSLRNSNLEAAYDINTLPRPVEVGPSASHFEQAPNQELPEIHESEFDKRNERLRDVPRQQDELAAAGMVALGDVLKDRQTAYAVPPSPATPTSRPISLPPTPPPAYVAATGWSLYKQAIVVGLVAGLLMAPVVIAALARG